MHKILLVDDDELFANMLQRFLIRSGYEVILAHNGGEALRLYNAEQVDVVLTELVMSETEGTELIIKIRRANPIAKIIAMSGVGRTHPGIYLATAQKLGAAVTLVKPFANEELLEAIRGLIPEKE